MISSDDEKAMMSEDCKMTSMVKKVFFRFRGSFMRWFWLAIIIKGSNQHDRTNSGPDRESI